MNPFVTAICPTANRRAHIGDAIQCFLQQTYPEKQLLIVDDGDEDISDLVRHPQITYLKTRRVGSLGLKRNLACSYAAPEVICHWDDDDVYSPNRIADQVERLQSTGAEITGYHSMMFADEKTRRVWRYRGAENYCIGVSLCYTKRFWKMNPFHDLSTGEDNEFQKQSKKVVCAPGDSMIVARVHGSNTCGKRGMLHDAMWTGAPGETWQEMAWSDLDAIGYPWIKETAKAA